MKMLVVNNGPTWAGPHGVCVDARTGKLVTDCSTHFESTTYAGGFPSDSTYAQCDYALDESRVDVVRVAVNRASRWSKVMSYLRGWGSVWEAVKQTDLIYVFWPGHLPMLFALAARMQKRPYGIYLRGELGKDSLVSRKVASWASFVIAEGELLADHTRRFCKDVELAVPMCDLSPQDMPAEKTIKTRGPWNLLFVGRVEERKGSLDLLEAASILHDRGVDFHLNLVGPNYLEELPPSFDRIRHRVTFAGMVSDKAKLQEYYLAADLFCFPSHDEGFPRVLYEATLFRVPVLTTFVGSISSFLSDGVNCLQLKVRDPSQLARTIEQALSDPPLREKLMENGVLAIEPVLRRMAEESHDRQVVRKVLEHIHP